MLALISVLFTDFSVLELDRLVGVVSGLNPVVLSLGGPSRAGCGGGGVDIRQELLVQLVWPGDLHLGSSSTPGNKDSFENMFFIKFLILIMVTKLSCELNKKQSKNEITKILMLLSF